MPKNAENCVSFRMSMFNDVSSTFSMVSNFAIEKMLAAGCPVSKRSRPCFCTWTWGQFLRVDWTKKLAFWKGRIGMQHIIVYINRRCYQCYLLMNIYIYICVHFPAPIFLQGIYLLSQRFHERVLLRKSLRHIPPRSQRRREISFSATSPKLSDKETYPYFLRTLEKGWKINAWGLNMRVSWNGGTLKWMVYSGKTNLKWMRTGGTPILGYLHIHIIHQPKK